MFRRLQTLARRVLPLKAVVRLQKLHYPRHVRRFSERDEPEVTIVRKLVTPSDTVIDAGAHVGKYTRILSEAVGPTGVVYALEPIPTTYALLIHCVTRLKLANVRPLPFGVSDVDRKAVMVVPRELNGYNFYQSSIAPITGDSADGLKFSVELRSLDGLFSSGERISFIKCDVEAHELEAITGAMNVLERSKPALMIEVSGDPDRSGTRADQLFRQLASLSYDAWWYDGMRFRRRRSGDRPVNYFFLSEQHVSQLSAQGIRVDRQGE